MKNESHPAATLAPVVTLRWEEAGDGTYRASMIVSGLRSEGQAQLAMQLMEQAFCAQELKVDA